MTKENFMDRQNSSHPMNYNPEKQTFREKLRDICQISWDLVFKKGGK